MTVSLKHSETGCTIAACVWDRAGNFRSHARPLNVFSKVHSGLQRVLGIRSRLKRDSFVLHGRHGHLEILFHHLRLVGLYNVALDVYLNLFGWEIAGNLFESI